MGTPAQILRFCSHLDSLKHLVRTGWVRCGVEQPETVAAHMYRMSLLAQCLPATVDGEPVDTFRCVRMALVHDLAEAIVGDITPHCGVSDEQKHKLESEAFDRIMSDLAAPLAADWRALWDEYELAETLAARLVKDLDKFDMLAQAFEYEKKSPHRGKFLQQFFDRTYGVFRTPPVIEWVAELKRQRDGDE